MIFRYIRRKLAERRRFIFRYYDGLRVQSADPIELATDLAAHKTYLHEHIGQAVAGDAEALAIVGDAACDVFGVEPLSEDGKRGLTVAERLQLVMAFDLYMAALKKNTAVLPIPQSSTASTSESSKGSTTSDMSASGSIVGEPPRGPQTSSV